MKTEMNSLIVWLESEAKNMSYGELSICLKIHDGKISLIETAKTERSKPELQS
jgi:hypothetical protein